MLHKPSCSRAELPNPSSTAIWGQVILWCGVYLVPYGKSATLIGCKHLPPSRDTQGGLQALPNDLGRQRHSWLRINGPQPFRTTFCTFRVLAPVYQHVLVCVTTWPFRLLDSECDEGRDSVGFFLSLYTRYSGQCLALSKIPRKMHTFWICT